MTDDPDRLPLDVDELRRGMGEFWSRLDVVAATGSTNADLVARGGDRAVLLAEHQTGGRGRHGRVWVTAPRAQIAMSVLLRMPASATAVLGWLPLLTGVAVTEVLRKTAKVDAVLKWPNDVLIDGRKVAGILAEMVTPKPGDGTVAVVVGVGVNVDLTESELPVPHAISLTLAGAEVVDRTKLAGALLHRLAEFWTAWRDESWAAESVAEPYRRHCATLGTRVRAELPGGVVREGLATDIDPTGRLLIDTSAGPLAVSAGDITHLRPSP